MSARNGPQQELGTSRGEKAGGETCLMHIYEKFARCIIFQETLWQSLPAYFAPYLRHKNI